MRAYEAVGGAICFFKHELLQWIQAERYREAQFELGLEQRGRWKKR